MTGETDADRQYIERTLGFAEWQWGRLPEVEAEIDSWDLLDQLHFIEEWPLEEERLKRMEKYRAEGALTEEQLARYEALQCVIAQNRPIIRRLQQS